MNKYIIAVDFDGTLCVNRYPEIGDPNARLINHLIDLRLNNPEVILILWTCRIGNELTDANVWCKSHGLFFDYVNENAMETIREFGTDSRKIFAHQYLDDRAVTIDFKGETFYVDELLATGPLIGVGLTPNEIRSAFELSPIDNKILDTIADKFTRDEIMTTDEVYHNMRRIRR